MGCFLVNEKGEMRMIEKEFFGKDKRKRKRMWKLYYGFWGVNKGIGLK